MVSKVNTEPEVIDIDLSATARRKFRINGDNTKLVELDPSDLSIITRIEAADREFEKCVKELEELAGSSTETDEEINELGRKFKNIDNRMRKILDNVFQSNVSEVCAPTGSMYDPINGKFRYEYILEALMNFYQTNIQNEYRKMKVNVAKKTSKYTGSKRK